MGKRRRREKGNRSSKRRPRDEDINPEDIDDEIDACKFHIKLILLVFYIMQFGQKEDKALLFEKVRGGICFILFLQFTNKGMLFLWI